MPVNATEIYTLADDALQNLFDVSIITPPSGITLPLGNMSLRVTEFTKPEIGFDVYEVHYKTLKIVKPTAKTTFSNEFSFTIRVDRAYEWYTFFERWNKAILNINTGAFASDTGTVGDPTNFRASMAIKPIDVGATGWKFDGAFPKTVPSISYTADSGEPVTCEITFGCNRMDYLV